jgi:hypothetical protein
LVEFTGILRRAKNALLRMTRLLDGTAVLLKTAELLDACLAL